MSGRPVLSVVIPVFREQANIGVCLDRIARQADASHVEVIVVDGDGGSTAVPAGPWPFALRCLQSPRGRGVQLHRGVSLARAPALLFLHVDTTLPRRAVPRILSALQIREAGAFSIRARTRHPLIKLVMLWASLRSHISRIPYGDQAHFIRASTYQRIGGYPRLPLMEDVALMRRLRSRGVRIVVLRSRVETSDRRWRREGVLRATLRNWRLYFLYLAGVPPGRLARAYRPNGDPEG